VYNKGKYTDVFNNYGPGLLSKYNLSGNVTRPVLTDSFKMFITADESKLKKLRLMHRTGLSKKVRARHAILKERNLSVVHKARSLCAILDGSERQKQNHEPLAETHTQRNGPIPQTILEFRDTNQAVKVVKSLVSDSTKAGKSGRGQASHIVNTIGFATCVESLSAVLFDTTTSNTGE
jgi:hypothetical protein